MCIYCYSYSRLMLLCVTISDLCFLFASIHQVQFEFHESRDLHNSVHFMVVNQAKGNNSMITLDYTVASLGSRLSIQLEVVS